MNTLVHPTRAPMPALEGSVNDALHPASHPTTLQDLAAFAPAQVVGEQPSDKLLLFLQSHAAHIQASSDWVGEFYGLPMRQDQLANMHGPVGLLARVLVPSVTTPEQAAGYQREFDNKKIGAGEFLARLVTEAAVERRQQVKTVSEVAGRLASTALRAVINPVGFVSRTVKPNPHRPARYKARHSQRSTGSSSPQPATS